MIKENYYIKEIPHDTALHIVIENHYLHRTAPCSFSFGLFEKKTDELKGVIIYGTPFSSTLRAGICGEDEACNVIELTRLWIADDVPKNGESFLIGGTQRLVDKEIIVSYAEISAGHLGAIYQATNWLYTGLSAKRSNRTIQGVDKHNCTLVDKYSAEDLKREFGFKYRLTERPRKHRYVYFNCDKRRRKELMKKLNYPVLSYPKKQKSQAELESGWNNVTTYGLSGNTTTTECVKSQVDNWL